MENIIVWFSKGESSSVLRDALYDKSLPIKSASDVSNTTSEVVTLSCAETALIEIKTTKIEIKSILLFRLSPPFKQILKYILLK